MRKAEIFMILLAINGLFIRLAGFEWGLVMMITTTSALSFFYLYLGFALFNRIPLKKILKKESYLNTSSMRLFGGVCTGMALSLSCVSAMFQIMSWPGGTFMLFLTLILLCIIFIAAFIKFNMNRSEYYSSIIKRCGIAALLCVSLLMLPQFYFIEKFYQDEPEKIEYIKEMMREASNKEP